MTEGQRLALAAHVRDACAEIALRAGFPGATMPGCSPSPVLISFVPDGTTRGGSYSTSGEVHHIKKRSLAPGQREDMDNLVLLSRDDHRRLHGERK